MRFCGIVTVGVFPSVFFSTFSFAAVNNAYIRALDGNGVEICRYNITREAGYEQYRSLTFAAVERHGQVWSFQALGQMHESDRFIDILKTYLPYAT